LELQGFKELLELQEALLEFKGYKVLLDLLLVLRG
jgi:hypothetical protein